MNILLTFRSKLERRTREEVFVGKYYPDKFDFKSLYLYPDILSAIFNEHIVGIKELQNRKSG
jgi:hypothetical protein